MSVVVAQGTPSATRHDGWYRANPDMYIGCIRVMDSSAGLLVCQEYVQKTMCCLLCTGVGAYVAEFD